MSELPKLEVCLYLCIWISGVFISLYRLFLIGQVFDNEYYDEYHKEDFKKGWKFLGERYQDQADYEWNAWTGLVIKLTPFLVINLIGAELMRSKKLLSALPLWYASVTVFFVVYSFNFSLILWFISQTLVYCFLILFKSYILIWVVSFVIIHFLKPEVWFIENEDDQYLVRISSTWMILRCISYSVDKLNDVNLDKKKTIFTSSETLVLLGYSFYLPTMFFGPFISFCYFDSGIKSNSSEWNCARVLKILKDFMRCLFWFFFALFALHFIYVNAILLRPEFVKLLVDWELAGLGIAMGHFFHLKYLVFYGIPCAWAAAEGFTTPKSPCCVFRVHLYSYMWRNFDHGLHQFLVRYIYVPIISKVKGKDILRKTLASIACFAFMFTWHGEHDYVFFWVLFNFVALTIELVVKQIYDISSVQYFLHHHISSRNKIRLQCFLAAPLHCFSMISNYFFIGNGMEIGFVYLKRIIYGSFQTKLTIWFFLYGAGQSAVEAQNWEKEKEIKKVE